MKEGANKWSSVSGSTFGLEWEGEGGNFSRNCDALTDPYNGIHWDAIDDKFGTYARVIRCWHSGTNTMHGAQMIVDRAESWYTGTGSVPSDQTDALSAAAHEFGHFLGFSGPYDDGHFNDTADVCTDPMQTMCPFLELWDKPYEVT